jgi:hypothetical protein
MKISLENAKELGKAVNKMQDEYNSIEGYSEDSSVHVRLNKKEYKIIIAVLINLRLEIIND